MANKYDENYVKTSEAAYEKQKEINQPKTAENNINRQEIAGKKPDSSTGFSYFRTTKQNKPLPGAIYQSKK
ncbi:MAG TPA: hypothetical protein DCS73_01830 [Roseburia sp.]|nr:hypothetical protein [Roseburia sp.]